MKDFFFFFKPIFFNFSDQFVDISSQRFSQEKWALKLLHYYCMQMIETILQYFPGRFPDSLFSEYIYMMAGFLTLWLK